MDRDLKNQKRRIDKMRDKKSWMYGFDLEKDDRYIEDMLEEDTAMTPIEIDEVLAGIDC